MKILLESIKKLIIKLKENKNENEKKIKDDKYN
jgi:hypothetical protein